MRTLFTASLVALSLVTTAADAVIPRPAKANDVLVTVAFTGKGVVDDTHEIWVYLFDSPAIGQGSMPIQVQALKKSGGATVFKGLNVDPVYVAVAYDEKGDYDGTAGPPPTGSPIAIYSIDGKGTAAPVKTAGGAKVKMSFSDTVRMQ